MGKVISHLGAKFQVVEIYSFEFDQVCKSVRNSFGHVLKFCTWQRIMFLYIWIQSVEMVQMVVVSYFYVF